MPAAARSRRADSGAPKARSDAYVGLLGLSLLALTAAMLFAYLSWNGISDKPPKAAQVAPKGAAPTAPPPAPGGPGAPVAAPQPGGAPGAPGAQQPAPPVPPPGAAQPKQ